LASKQNMHSNPQLNLNIAYKRRPQVIFTIISSHISLSLLVIGHAFLGNLLSHTCEGKEDRFLLTVLTSIDRATGRLFDCVDLKC